MEKSTCPVKFKSYPIHGGSHYSVLADLGVSDKDVIDFSASVNPLGPSPDACRSLGDVESILTEYPDPGSHHFREKVSQCLNFSSEQVLVTNGSTELIHLLPRLVASGKEALIINPCFSEYESALRLNRIPVHSLEYHIDSQVQIHADEVTDFLRTHPKVEMLILGHPNNPTGQLWSEQSLSALIRYCESQQVVLVVDETFIEFCGEQDSTLKWMEGNSILIVVRSMTKFYGLAGVRLGYGVMHPTLKAKLESYQIPWSVNGVAQKMGILALDDEEYAVQTRSATCAQREYMFSALDSFLSIHVFSSQANFLFFQLLVESTEKARQFYMGLVDSGVLIRNCGNFRGLDERFFRVAVRSPEDNRRLFCEINAYFSRGG